MDMPQTDPLSTTFAALADPTRRAIHARLAQGEASVKDLAEPFDMSQPAISEHLRVLVGSLRKKIEPDPSSPRYILTEPWVGYRFADLS